MTACSSGAGRSPARRRASNSACVAPSSNLVKRWYRCSNQSTGFFSKGLSHCRSCPSLAPLDERARKVTTSGSSPAVPSPSTMWNLCGGGSRARCAASRWRGKFSAKAA